MKQSKTAQESEWQKTPYANLVRYKSSDIYFARLRVRGKLIRRSLKTTQLSVAKLRLADLEKEERQRAEHQTSVADDRDHWKRGEQYLTVKAIFQGTQPGAAIVAPPGGNWDEIDIFDYDAWIQAMAFYNPPNETVREK